MSMGLGPSFDRAQAAYDARSPHEDGPPVEVECRRCHRWVEVDHPDTHYCDECNRALILEGDE